MAKSSLASRLSALPTARHGVSLRDQMNDKQRQDFDEAMAWWHERTPATRPSRDSFTKEVAKILGMALSSNSLTRYLRDDGYNKKKT